MSTIEQTLSERGSRYGTFMANAMTAQRIKAAMHATKNWDNMKSDKREALEMIAHKIGRILNGDPDYPDSWIDIIGYATLVADTLPDDRTKIGDLSPGENTSAKDIRDNGTRDEFEPSDPRLDQPIEQLVEKAAAQAVSAAYRGANVDSVSKYRPLLCNRT